MYTGITRGLFPVVQVEPREGVTGYAVELSPELLDGLVPGASVSIDGTCATVVSIAGLRVHFEAVAATLACTTLDALHVGRRVSVERSARAGDELGGHEVFGHVKGTGAVFLRRVVGEQVDLGVRVPPEWMKYILQKGFVALDGSSLTVDEVDPRRGAFVVHLIPTTQRLTGLGEKSVGDRLNVELDARTVAIVDTVERVLAARGEAL
jgi:riboflavin synthase